MRYLLISLMLTLNVFAEEGMYPLSELNELDLKQKGFQINANDIFNENGGGLSRAIVKVGGCTGSFVSENGLILTNHHCAFRAAQAVSSEENDYVENGFIAQNKKLEIPAKGYTVRITVSYKDVSLQVLSAINDEMSFQEKSKKIKKIRKKLEKEAEKKHPGKRAEVAEMFIGQSYVLYLYTYLKDVRMVYIPPRSIGEFGGDIDNWEWPRHTGDFAFLRAYTAPDGSPAEYAEENIPYQSSTYLKVNAQGLEDEDLVFILGYPGRTYRNRPSHFMAYLEDVRMPWLINWYQWQMNLIEKLGTESESARIRLSSHYKGLANREKNYRGKLLGMKRLKLTETKKKEESKMLQSDKTNEADKKVIEDIDALYKKARQSAESEYILSFLSGHINLLSVARTIVKAAEERAKEDLDREAAYMDRNFKQTQKRLLIRLEDYVKAFDKKALAELINRNQRLKDSKLKNALAKIFGKNIEQTIDEAYQKTKLSHTEFVKKALTLSFAEVKSLNDPILNWYLDLKPLYQESKERSEKFDGAIKNLAAKWAEIKKKYSGANFIPDANGSFRFTYGHIRGYSPKDAVIVKPFTSLQGIVEKNTGKAPFNAPEKLIRFIKENKKSRFSINAAGDVPVCILYNMDTTGGNSGSPVMNNKGELVGLNFDRAFEATINDFAWNESYSRSIGVDIRYILWLLENYASANYLLDEMGI
jgi:hypothetical protein